MHIFDCYSPELQQRPLESEFEFKRHHARNAPKYSQAAENAGT